GSRHGRLSRGPAPGTAPGEPRAAPLPAARRAAAPCIAAARAAGRRGAAGHGTRSGRRPSGLARPGADVGHGLDFHQHPGQEGAHRGAGGVRVRPKLLVRFVEAGKQAHVRQVRVDLDDVLPARARGGQDFLDVLQRPPGLLLKGAVDEGPRFQVHGNLAGHEDEVAGPHGRRQGHLRGDVVQLDHVPGHGHPPLVYKCAQNYFPGAAPNSSCARTGRAGFVAPAADRSGKPDPGACCPSTAGRPVNMLNSRFPASAKRWREMPDPGTCRCAKRACRRDPRRGEEPDPSIALPEGRDGMAHDGGNASQGPMRPWAAGDNGTPAGQVSQLVREGCRLLELSRLAGAQRKFQQALRLCATSVAARSHLAFTYLLQEKHEQAAAEAEAALRFDPDHVLALTTLARAQAEGGREPEAKEAARRALRAFYARWRAGEAQRAEVAWVAAALAAVEDDQRLYQLYRWCVRGAAGPWDAMALTWLGVAAFNQGRYREARWLWRSAMGQRPALDDVLKAYLFVVDAIETERVPPFALDYRLQLESPPPKAEEPPGYVRAVALRTLWQGEDDRAREAALDLL